MSENEWNTKIFETLEAMKEHVEPFITSIWKYKEENDILPHGSGSYFESDGEIFLITNAHVARQIASHHLTHAFKGNTGIFNIREQFVSDPYPRDVAISKIDNSVWADHRCEAQAIPLERFAKQHMTADGELLFFAGFTGQRSQVVFGNCISRGTPFMARECELPETVEQADPEFHLAIPYPPELVQTNDPSVPLPDPHGFSGSLLWDTKLVRAIQNNVEWNPLMSEVTGVIWAWPSSAVSVLATKIEHINLKEMIHAYHALQ